LQQAGDAEVFAKAESENRIIVSADTDFASPATGAIRMFAATLQSG
jgi:predicted nuclease of predicted toxin-antitoxin system